MKKTAMIRARVEPDIKEKAEAVFVKLGVNASEAIGLFYQQVHLRQGLPFELNLSASGRKSGLAEYTRSALVTQSKNMSPAERLNAFKNQSLLLKKIEQSGREARTKKAGGV